MLLETSHKAACRVQRMAHAYGCVPRNGRVISLSYKELVVKSCLMRRRQFLVLSASGLGGVLAYSVNRCPVLLNAQVKASKALRIPLRFFRAQEALIVAAAASRIFPSDESGPGAHEAGVVIYIDRQLAGPYGLDGHRYTSGPFDENASAEFGYQGRATPRQIYRVDLKKLSGFDQLSAAAQDAKLREIENTLFFSLLRQHTIEGMFCDPLHGGNLDMVGWQLIGFPGPRMSNYAEVDQYRGEAFRPKPVSLSQVIGHKLYPSEDEDRSQ
jgi:gluconate 2-dehydrogenase gamma chain